MSYAKPDRAKTYTNHVGARIVVAPIEGDRFDMEWLDDDGQVKQYRQAKPWTYVASCLRQGQYR